MRCSFDSSSLSMASLDPVDGRARGQLRHAALSRVGASKAQAALAKIIAIITAAPPPGPSPDAIRYDELKGGGTPPPAERTGRVDLRLRLGPPPEIAGGSAEGNRRATGGPVEWVCALAASGKMTSEAGRSFSPAISAAPCGGGDALTGSRSSEGECDPSEIENGKESHEEIAATAGSTVFNSTSTTSSSRTRSRAGYLDLLLEAVRQVSGVDAPAADKRKPEAATAVDEKGQQPPTPPGAKRTKEAEEHRTTQFDVYEEAETAPIVRSKRGRSQALPSRYRDSILDPWRKPPAIARHGRAARP